MKTPAILNGGRFAVCLRISLLRAAGNQQLARPAMRVYGSSPEGEQQMAHGTVKWFNPDKGYGFIASDDGTPDVFGHYSVIDAGGYLSLDKNRTLSPGAQGAAGGPGPPSLTKAVRAGPRACGPAHAFPRIRGTPRFAPVRQTGFWRHFSALQKSGAPAAGGQGAY